MSRLDFICMKSISAQLIIARDEANLPCRVIELINLLVVGYAKCGSNARDFDKTGRGTRLLVDGMPEREIRSRNKKRENRAC